jgi:hypothetical protein
VPVTARGPQQADMSSGPIVGCHHRTANDSAAAQGLECLAGIAGLDQASRHAQGR